MIVACKDKDDPTNDPIKSCVEKKPGKPRTNLGVPHLFVCRGDKFSDEFRRRNMTQLSWSMNEYLLYFFIVLLIAIIYDCGLISSC